MNQIDQDQYDRWKEVPQKDGKYIVVLRAGGNDTSVLFYKSKEDLKWALLNSWFDEKTPVVAKLIDISIEVKE